MQCRIFLFTALIFCTLNVNAQQNQAPEKPTGIVKLNVFPLVLGNFSVQGEFPFRTRLSGALGLSFLPGLNLNSARAQSEPMLLRGFAITPELRIYTGRHGAPRGFYLAPYLRYVNYRTSRRFDREIAQITGGAVTEAELFARFRGTGIGLMVGSQWFIKNRFSIDWWALGGHLGGGSLGVGIDGYNDLSLSSTQLADLEDEIDRAAGLLRFVSFAIPGVNFTRNSAFVRVPLPYAGIRTGITLGWAF
jgi:hypothetical protein